MALIWHVTHLKKPSSIQVGECIFTPREVDIISCYINGRSSKHIAMLLSLSTNTIEVHTRNIFQKMHINSREEIINRLENSDFYDVLKSHYFYLTLQNDYRKCLSLLEPLCQGKEISFSGSSPLMSNLKKDVQALGLKITTKKQSFLIETTSVSEMESILKFKTSKSLNHYGFYEVAFLSILKEADSTLSSIINPFLEKYEKKLNSPKQSFLPSMKKKYTYWMGPIILLFLIVLGYEYVQTSKYLISNLYLLPKSKLFIREKDLNTLERLFNNKQELSQNPVVAIVGMGGAGKTTLSRFYGKTYGKHLVWEINAQSKELLEQSLESLASRIGDLNEKNQKEYSLISKGFGGKERFLKLFHFIQKYLRKSTGWTLIYEDLKLDYGDIAEYLMLDSDICGEGKILITTRNANIRFAIHHQNVFELTPLTLEEKRQLFYQIIESCGDMPKEQVDLFLSKLPPFPFDVSVATHHLSQGGCSIDQYVNQLSFKEIGTYSETRHHILLLTIQDIMEEKKEFKDLLFLLAVIDYTDIPLEFLEECYGQETVNAFIHALKKHSLITHIGYKYDLRVFSLHESIHKNLVTYLKSLLGQNFQKDCQDKIFNHFKITLGWRRNPLKRYYSFSRLCKELVRHALIAVNMLDLLDEKKRTEMKVFVGRRTSMFGNFIEGEKLLLAGLDESKNMPDILGEASMYLGEHYATLGKSKEADYFLHQSLKLTQIHNPQDIRRIYMTLLQMAMNFRNMGNYQQALDYAQRAYKLVKTNKDFSENDLNNEEAFFKCYLGFFYNELENYREAEEVLKEAKLSKNAYHVALSHMHLGYTCLFKGFYKEAETMLKEAYKNYGEIYDKSHVMMGWIQGLIGLNYGFLQRFRDAHNYLEEGYKNFKNHFGENHTETARHIQYMGIVAFLEGNYDEAKEFLNKSIEIFKSHPKARLSKEYLEKIYKIQIKNQ